MFKKIIFIFLSTTFFTLIVNLSFLTIFKPLYLANSVNFYFSLRPFDICLKYPEFWKLLKNYYILFLFLSNFIIFSYFSSNFYNYILSKKNTLLSAKKETSINNSLSLIIGFRENGNFVSIPEKSLYQNILITGTIGSGKTSSAMYPFTSQLISYEAENIDKKIGMLILDVKGNYYLKTIEYAKKYNRINDIIIIDLYHGIKYNPLDKPNLKASVLANRLKTILELFSVNNSDSYWLDKVEQVLTEAIKLCRLYNDNYVTFLELHKLINEPKYYIEKIQIVKKIFLSGKFSSNESYDLLTSINFFETEFNSLDSRTQSIIKSEITRITNTFISDYNVLNTFCPKQKEINFSGFSNTIKTGKIVILNMNISEYQNLSKIIATYLKLDFQTEVMCQLNNSNNIRTSCFISDEYHEYITSSDANFFSQCREAKCINILATQSYSSLLNTLHNENSLKVILQNLINKIWFRTDDIFTIEYIQKQLGKEDKIKFTKSISENAKQTNYNYFLKSFYSTDSVISESINSQVQNDFIFDTNFFTQELQSFKALTFLSDGNKILKPEKLNLIPYFLIEKR